MGRRRKQRLVESPPVANLYKPQGVPMGRLKGLVLAVEELEAMRLVDAEGLSQEEAAERMGVSRPTLCRILGSARSSVARALSLGWAIRIEGGDHTFCQGQGRGQGRCQGQGQGGGQGGGQGRGRGRQQGQCGSRSGFRRNTTRRTDANGTGGDQGES